MNSPSGALVEQAAALSHYAGRLLAAEPRLAQEIALDRAFGRAEMRAALDAPGPGDDAALKLALRALRKRVMLTLIARDLGGLASLAEVVETTTTLAEVTTGHALTRLAADLRARHGQPVGQPGGRAQQLHVVGMGKLGGAELNVSSDVDLVFAYPEEGETAGPRSISNHEYFTRLGKRLIAALSEVTPDGYVFRVDMRLRPYGDGGPLVSSFEMLENYFITQGREWERYAWIKGRALTGERGAELDDLVRPFVYRRHLDYNAFAALRDLHRQIRLEVERRDISDNIKLGAGGIREIEFVAQVFQIVRGGHDAGLRLRPTLATLACLAQRRLLPAEAVEELRAAYVFLRNLEHRLQYLEDQQTQMLPADPEDLAAVAHAMGCADAAALRTVLEGHRSCVTRHFEAVFASTACVSWSAIRRASVNRDSITSASANNSPIDSVRPVPSWMVVPSRPSRSWGCTGSTEMGMRGRARWLSLLIAVGCLVAAAANAAGHRGRCRRILHRRADEVLPTECRGRGIGERGRVIEQKPGDAVKDRPREQKQAEVEMQSADDLHHAPPRRSSGR
jgi:glutamate-ammonia-ligase adenylyltransferase